MRAREATRWSLVLLAMVPVAAVQTWLAYFINPIIAFLAPVAAALVAAIFFRPMLGVYLGLLTIPLELFEVTLGSVGLSATEAVLIVTAGAAICRRLVGAFERRPSLHVAHVALLGMLVLAGGGLLLAPEPGEVLRVLVLWASFLAVSILVASSSEQEVERALLCLVVSAAAVAVVALATASDPEALRGGQLVSNRAEGTFSHPNQLAFLLVLTIPLSLAMIRRGGPTALVAVLAAGVQVAALLSTYSRSGIIGLTVAFLILLAWPGFRRLVVVLLVGVLVFSAFNFEAISRNKQLTILSQRLQTVTTAEGRRQNPRLRIYATALDMIAARPWLGTGLRNFSVVSPRFGLRDNRGESYVHAHDVFLTIAVEIGVPALALFVAFLATLARAGWRALTRRPDVYPIVLALSAALVGIIVTGITEYPLGINVIMATFLVEAGALLAYARAAGNPGQADQPTGGQPTGGRSAELAAQPGRP